MIRIIFSAFMIFMAGFIAGIEYKKYNDCDRYYNFDYGRCTYAEPFGSGLLVIKKFQ